MMALLCRVLTILSLKQVHALGKYLGKISMIFDQKANQVAVSNLKQSGLYKTDEDIERLMKISRLEAGKLILESLYIWGAKGDQLQTLIKQVSGLELIEAAHQKGKGLIFLTPHLGCFEITSIFYGHTYPITVLFRPPKIKLIEEILLKGRQKGLVDLAPASPAGVKKLLQALKRGEAIGILPDQIPKKGEGEWAPFFGKPAYTMRLASKLAVKSGATVIMAFGERLPDGQGYHIHLSKVDDISSPTLLNQAIEQQIAQRPEQYLWQYNHYKQRDYALRKLQITTSNSTKQTHDEQVDNTTSK